MFYFCNYSHCVHLQNKMQNPLNDLADSLFCFVDGHNLDDHMEYENPSKCGGFSRETLILDIP